MLGGRVRGITQSVVGANAADAVGRLRVDLTLLGCDARGAACEPLDMGTDFDFFGLRANTASPAATLSIPSRRSSLLMDLVT